MAGERQIRLRSTIGAEPAMQADKWGAAGSVADGVRSNVTLGVDSLATPPQTLVT